MRRVLFRSLTTFSLLFFLLAYQLGYGQALVVVDGEHCKELAEAAYRECRADGGTERECQDILNKLLDHCESVDDSPDDLPEPLPDDCLAACDQLSEDIFEDCRKRGNSEADCRRHADEFRVSCQSRCAPPDPDPTCEEVCDRAGRTAFEFCRSQDGTDGDCERVARNAKAACLSECGDVPADIPPASPSCESLCKLRAIAETETCMALWNDSAECERKRLAVFEHCVNDCDRDPPPPIPVCKNRCADTAESLFERCVNAGNEPEECKAKARRFLDHCLVGCERLPPLPCTLRCRLKFSDIYNDCVDKVVDVAEVDGIAKGAVDAVEIGIDDCRERLAALIDECVIDCEPPQPPRPCLVCLEEAAAAQKACVEEGGERWECAVKAHRVFNACVEEKCEPADPPPCIDRCANLVDEAVQECIEEFSDPEGCAKRGESLRADCLTHCGDPPEPPTCEERCENLAKTKFNECLRYDREPEECRAEASSLLEGCLLRCDDEPRPSCPEKCRAGAERIFEECSNDGGDPERCEVLAGEAFEICRQCCERPDPPRCDDKCAKAARLANGICIELGWPEAQCEARAKRVLEHCLNGCDRPPPPRPCVERCNTASAILLRLCHYLGFPGEVCEEKVATFTERCRNHCDHGHPPTCRTRCSGVARRFLAECVEEHGDEEECRKQADDILCHCLFRCTHRPQRCADRCAVRARDLFSRCLERLEEEIKACVEQGGTERGCRARAIRKCKGTANEFLTSCIRENCPTLDEPPPPCTDRCRLAAEDLQHDCEERGGEPEDCAKKAEDFLTECLPQCGGPKPPDCDVQCEEVVAAFRERCAQSDRSDAECEELAESLLRKCEHRLGEICDLEVDALKRAPLAFKRGDVNLDSAFDVSDVVECLHGLFLGKLDALNCEDAADMDDSGNVDIGDAVYGLLWLFRSGSPLPPPTDSGHDPTLDDLLCEPR